jgi:hypothetical protein
VVVIVRHESLGFWRRDVGIDLGFEVRLDLERVRKRGDRLEIALESVHDDGVSGVEVVANSDEVDRTIGEAITLRRLLLFGADETDYRGIGSPELKELLEDPCAEQPCKVFRAIAPDDVVRDSPNALEELFGALGRK